MAANTDAGKAVDEAATAVNDATTSAAEQIAALRKQVEELYADRQKYLSQAMDAAEGYAARAADTAQVQYEQVADRVRERPAQSLLIAAAVGFILARILGR
ncbi:protein of unknown function [Roseomonas rosea]|uniref:Membrane-anchored ribosome-binding protein, inhibits growth in stationary phase, ElaB/YqjD/DUF883 family n=1 Tax=Muricoccus roseus TaxID=198092 RepID=A0A1M6M1U5_9PROT|nr:DUF883 family protein [Roseomonas rosea]SHJ77303.1 protein of unknown function [Roseomonas rosea]